MDYFFENPLARMYGPFFLAFYAVVTFLVIYFLRHKSKRLINTEGGDEHIQIPLQPDPFEIAYLKGGERQVLLLAIYSLISRGYFNVLTNKEKTDVRVGQKEKSPPVNVLTAPEKMVFNYTTKKEMPIVNFLHESFSGKFTECCEPYKKKLEKDNLLVGEEAEKKFKTLKLYCSWFIFALAVYKLIAAVIHGHHNIFFLILFTIAAIVLINNVQKVKLARRISYLGELKTAFSAPADNGFDMQPFYMRQLQVAIYGTEGLKYTKQNYLSSYYQYKIENQSNTFWERPDLYERDSWLFSTNVEYTINIINSCGSSGCGSVGSSCGSSCGGGCGGGCGGCS